MPLTLILNDNQKVPTVVERLIKAIELNGLFMVGVYRKAGAAGKIKELLHLIDTGVLFVIAGTSSPSLCASTGD